MLVVVTSHAGAMRRASDSTDVLVRVVVLVLLATTVGVGSWLWWRDGTSTDPTSPTAATTRREAVSAARSVRQGAAARVLAGWNERRSAAWARGDVAALAALYADDEAARLDVARLRRWLARGLVVDGLTTQVLRAEVRVFTDSRLTVEVTDRVAAAVARPAARSAADGSAWALPRDGPDTSLVTLRRVGGEWLLASATPLPSA